MEVKMAIPFLSPSREHMLMTPLLYGVIGSAITLILMNWLIPPPIRPPHMNLIMGAIFFTIVAFMKFGFISMERDNQRRSKKYEADYQNLLAAYTLESHTVYDEHHRLYKTGQLSPEANILRATLMPNGDLMHVFSVKSPSGETLRGMTVWKRNESSP
jgi:hypothetical protein